MKKVWLALCTSIMLLLPLSAVHAETDESEVTVTGSGLQMTQTQPRFSDVTLSVKNTQTTQATNDLYVMDARVRQPGGASRCEQRILSCRGRLVVQQLNLSFQLRR
ncbi:hypothetical protein JI735_19305 [Paenibacillus sonchi]|uniref:Uncharacterized protein n=1 Tax=Paenibacillus sonchi TaxID=373687 RepID=A0A974P8J7_9BACL|nr:hypothetical protein [Paenibacillus sonchi]QQZ58881.1 hypothetical protein JI735_19305 [Paenibacillus sonchi]